MYKRKSDSKWVEAIPNGLTEKGKRSRIMIYGDTELEATQKANIAKYELQTGQYAPPQKGSLIEFLKDYHKVCAGYDMWEGGYKPPSSKWEETTAELYKMYIDVHYVPYFGNMKLADIKTITLDTFYNYKLTDKRERKVFKGGISHKVNMPPLSLNTVIKLNKFLKSAFNYAVVNDKIRKNPTIGIKLSSPVVYEPVVYNEEQFLELLNSVHGKDEEIPIMLGAGCGLRRGEMCGLSWENIDFTNKTISIEKTNVRFKKNMQKDPKNKSSKRVITAPDYVMDILQVYYRLKGEPKKREKIITRWLPQSLSEMFSNLLDRYKLEHIRLHDLRHYNAVIMMNSGIPDKVAAERLGHSNVATLHKVYQHVQKSIDKSTAEIINNSIKPKEVVKEEKKEKKS